MVWTGNEHGAGHTSCLRGPVYLRDTISLGAQLRLSRWSSRLWRAGEAPGCNTWVGSYAYSEHRALAKGKEAQIKTVVARFADRFWKKEWPGQNRPLVYYDRRSVNKQLLGKLHAKVVVADEEHVFITSANLTRRAWDDNVELGILVRDADLAGSVIAHVQGLIDARVLWKLPRETGPAAS
ncbi:MAG: hypothetical protein F4Z28_10440 [Gammaproteobacteria bacterium]|nr:hypothetical protein [Gammaproteobacteria bacterium]